MRTTGEQVAYLEGMRAGALRMRIYTEGRARGDVRAAERIVNGTVRLCAESLHLPPDHGLLTQPAEGSAREEPR